MKLVLINGDGTVVDTYEDIETLNMYQSLPPWDVINWLRWTLKSREADENETKSQARFDDGDITLK